MTRDPLVRQLDALGPVDPGLLAMITDGARPRVLAGIPAAAGSTRRRRRRSRVLIVLAAFAILLAIVLPAAALQFGVPDSVHRFLSHDAKPETVHQFLASDAPPQAKETIRREIANDVHESWKIRTITPEVATSSPEGQVSLYRLRFSQGLVGLALIDTGHSPPRVGGVTAGPPPLLQAGDVIDVALGAVRIPNRDPYYFAGTVAPQVARVEYVDPLGDARPIATAHGYVLGWLAPRPDGRYGYGELIARDASGAAIGRVDICETPANQADLREHSAGMPDDVKAACALPRQRNG
jgi:hypothetical protein